MANQLKDGDGALPFFLDDLDCNGSERNLLECLPRHNCELTDTMVDESVSVNCSRKGSAKAMSKQLVTQCVHVPHCNTIGRSQARTWSE